MLSFVDLSKTAIEQHQGVLDYVNTWLDSNVDSSKLLSPEGWFQEGHGVIGREKNPHECQYLDTQRTRRRSSGHLHPLLQTLLWKNAPRPFTRELTHIMFS